MKTTGLVYNGKNSYRECCSATRLLRAGVKEEHSACSGTPRVVTPKQDHKPTMALLRHSSLAEQYKWKHRVMLRKTQCM